jgi:hypothetical protein
MLFTLEALNGQQGDALLLHYADSGAPRLVMVDGGPANTFLNAVKPRLDALRATRAGAGPLPIRLLMVSHIDDDHIHGVLDFTGHLLDKRASGEQPPYEVTTLWHNSFDDVIGAAGTASVAEVASAAGASLDDFLAGLRVREENAAVVQSVGQGRRLRDDAKQLALNVNSPFGALVSGPGTRPPVTLPGGLKLTVLGPSQARLDALQRKWDAELKKAKKKGASPAEVQDIVAKIADNAVENLSSLIVLAEMGSKRILLTGDARGDSVVEGLKAAGLLKDGRFEVDVLKVPHHGSKRNINDDFFRTVVAKHYVISANGANGNPDVDTLRSLSAARGSEEITVHLTNRVPHAVEFLDADSKEKGYDVRYREKDELSLRIDLGERLPD